MKQNKHLIGSVLLSALMLLAIKLDITTEITGSRFLSITDSIRDGGLQDVVLLLGLIVLLYSSIKNLSKKDVCGLFKQASILIPAFLFSFFQTFGRSFEAGNSWDFVLGDSSRIVESIFVFFLFFFPFLFLINKLYSVLENRSIAITKDESSESADSVAWRLLFKKYKRSLVKKPVVTTFITLIILYIPYVVALYPGLLSRDSLATIVEGFNEAAWTTNKVALINPEVKITRWHSVSYIELQHFFILAGQKLFGSYNIGLFLMSLFQLLLVALVISIAVNYLVKTGVNENLIVLLIAYYGVNYRVMNNFFVQIKDTLYSFLFLLLLLILVRVFIKKNEKGLVDYIELTALGVLLCTLRNEAVYILVPSFLILALWTLKDKQWKKALTCGVLIIACMAAYNSILDHCEISRPSKGEMLSVPFQQTARYMRDCPDDVTAEEKAAINSVLDADSIGELYDPSMSDSVKNTYKKEASDDDIKMFLTTWLALLKKHPGVMIQATMNNYYDYFYISGKQGCWFIDVDWSRDSMEKLNSSLEKYNMDVHYPDYGLLNYFRKAYENVSIGVFNLPIVGLLNKAGCYSWILILYVSYVFRRKSKWRKLSAFFMLLLLIVLVGPSCGAYFRYIYPLAIMLPVLILLLLWTDDESSRTL